MHYKSSKGMFAGLLAERSRLEFFEKRFRIHAKFLKIFVKFQNTGKALVKFNKNRVLKNEVVV